MMHCSNVTSIGNNYTRRIYREGINCNNIGSFTKGWVDWKLKNQTPTILWLLILRPNISKIIIFQRIFRMSALSSFSDIHSKWIVASGVPDLSNPVYVVRTALPARSIPLCHTRMEDTLLYTFELLYAMHWIGYQLAVTQLEHWICGRAVAKLTRRGRTFPVDERKVSKEFNTD